MSPNDYERIWTELDENRRDITSLKIVSETGLRIMEDIGDRLVGIERKQYDHDIREARRKGQASVYGSASGAIGGILTALAVELIKVKLGY